MSRNRVIGAGGALPWHLPEDLRHFKRLTLGHAIIMGRATYESIGRPLPGRRTIVLSRRLAAPPGVEIAASLEEGIARARETDEAPRIVGGGEVYREALPLATRIHLTEVDRVVEGDTFFPELDAGWVEVEAIPGEGVVYRTLERR